MVNGKRQHASSSKRSNKDNEQPTNANEEQRAKRSRVSRACDQCRASREKCDGAQPTCQTCNSQERLCSYNEQPKKRGIPPNYIRTLELALAWVFQTYPEIEQRLISSLPVRNGDIRRLIEGEDAAITETLHAAWRESLISKQIEQLLSGSTLDATGQVIGSAAVAAADDPDHSPTLSAPSNGSRGRPTQQPFSEDEYRAGRQILDEETPYQLPTDAWTLLEYYFAFTHSWLPMADKSSILKTMYTYPTAGLPRHEISSAEHAELWAIMALVLVQRSDGRDQHDVVWTRQLAESLLPTGNASFELPHIRASIILAMIDMLGNHMLAAWLRIGSVVRLLYLFHLLKSLGQVTKWCRHIHLVAFVLESALALHMRTPGHMTVDYITSVGFVDEDGMEEWAPWQDPLDVSPRNKAPTQSFSTLNQLARIYMRMGEDQLSSTISESTKSIAFDLINNAALKTNRIQPAILLGSQSNGRKAWSSNAQNLQVPSAITLATSGYVFQDDNAPEASNSNQAHPFMSIPNEAAMYNTSIDPSEGPASSQIWDAGSTFLPSAAPISPEVTMDGPSTDIFEELASLERQDSIQQPQFLRNLGFSADLDLAEFFGADYQMSDPLLAYLNPSSNATAQNGL